jgi:hypothetical protein
MNIPRIFLDSDVVFAGSASPSEHGASHVILCMGEISFPGDIHSRILFLPADFQSPTLPPHFKQAHGSAARRISLFYQTDALHLCHEIVSPGRDSLAGLTL